MDKLFIGAVGIGGWDEYTWPLIQSVVKHAPDARLRVLDNASNPPYPRNHWTYRIDEDDPWPYAAALNLLTSKSDGCDWLLLTNNDVLVTQPIESTVAALDPLALYGFYEVDLIERGIPTFLSGWALLMHRSIYEAIGKFDELFYPMYFEDADYSYRARQLGIPLVALDRDEFGIFHAEGRHEERRVIRERWMPFYQNNLDYLKEKHL